MISIRCMQKRSPHVQYYSLQISSSNLWKVSKMQYLVSCMPFYILYAIYLTFVKKPFNYAICLYNKLAQQSPATNCCIRSLVFVRHYTQTATNICKGLADICCSLSVCNHVVCFPILDVKFRTKMYLNV